MITFKPFGSWIGRYKTQDINDWFHFGLIVCNEVRLTIEVYGYGFSIGALIYDINKQRGNGLE